MKAAEYEYPIEDGRCTCGGDPACTNTIHEDGPMDDEWIHTAWWNANPPPAPPDTLITMVGR